MDCVTQADDQPRQLHARHVKQPVKLEAVYIENICENSILYYFGLAKRTI